MVDSHIEKASKMEKSFISKKYRENGSKKVLPSGELQLRIAKQIINYGIRSPFDVEDKLNKSRTLSNNTFTKMKENGYLNKIKLSDRKTYYSLSKDGIRWVLDKGQLTNDEFFNLMSLIDDKESNKIKLNSKQEQKEFSIQELFKKQFPQLDYYRNYFNPFGTDKIFELNRNLLQNEKEFLNDSIQLLAYYLNKDEKAIYSGNEKDDGLHLELWSKGLTYMINDESKISIFGVMLFLHYFSITPESDIPDESDKNALIHKIIHKHKKLLPRVFPKWKKLRKICNNDEKLFETLSDIFLLNFDKMIADSFKEPEMRILVEQYMLENECNEKLEFKKFFEK